MSTMIKKDSKKRVYPDLTIATMQKLLDEKFTTSFDLEKCLQDNQDRIEKYKIDEDTYYKKVRKNK